MPLPVLLIRVICLAGLIFLLGPNPVSVASEDNAKVKVDRAYLYEHPKAGYFVGIPVNVTLQDRGANKGIAIKSRRGYQVTVQTNPASSQLGLINMLSRLESKYLGKGKPWSRKLRQGSTTVAGLDAVEAQYEGAGVRVRVIIVRGTRLDYVFIFLASPLNFEKLVGEFNWIIASFRPAPGDLARPGKAVELSNTFASRELGFSVNFPTDWVVERQGRYVVVIGGKSGTPAYFATISLQNIKTENTQADAGVAVSSTLQGLKKQIIEADGQAKFSAQGPYVHKSPGYTLQGGQFTVTYRRGKVGYKQLTIVLPRSVDGISHVWSYAAPAADFQQFSNIARSVLQSWVIHR